MLSISLRHLRAVIACVLALTLCVQPAMAQSVLRDAETEAFFDEISAPLIRAAGLDPANVDIVLINDRSINAFVAGGQIVYIHSGLIEAAKTANEVQGVIAHELGHIEDGHVIRYSDGASAAGGISIATLILAAAAIAAGAGEAGMGIMAAGQQAALGKFLAFSRVQESVADSSGARYLSAAGITGRGSINFFKKLQNYEFRLGIPQVDSYDRTHPLSGERITFRFAGSPHEQAALVSGLVRDEGGGPVADAVVTCDACEQSVLSGADGRFSIGKPAFQREFTLVAKKGRRTATRAVTDGALQGLELVLKPGVGASYDVVDGFTPIILIGTQSLFAVATTASGVKDMKELVAAAKAGRISTYASPGSGSPMHILGELFNKSAGIKLTQVAYRGSGPAINDMLGGHIQMMFADIQVLVGSVLRARRVAVRHPHGGQAQDVGEHVVGQAAAQVGQQGRLDAGGLVQALHRQSHPGVVGVEPGGGHHHRFTGRLAAHCAMARSRATRRGTRPSGTSRWSACSRRLLTGLKPRVEIYLGASLTSLLGVLLFLSSCCSKPRWHVLFPNSTSS